MNFITLSQLLNNLRKTTNMSQFVQYKVNTKFLHNSIKLLTTSSDLRHCGDVGYTVTESFCKLYIHSIAEKSEKIVCFIAGNQTSRHCSTKSALLLDSDTPRTEAWATCAT